MADRIPWNAGRGLPQLFRLGDIVRVRRDLTEPVWLHEWNDALFCIIGVKRDDKRPGRVCYLVHEKDDTVPWFDPWAEDWLEKCDG